MGRKSKFLAKKRLDKFYHLAKDEGYKSRAAFKLIQINREYNFLGNCKCLIDLCAAPGGWTQVASKYMPLSSHIIAVDITKMKKFAGCVTLQQDITTQKCKFEIKKHLHGSQVDCVLHDGAPNVSGAWAKDAYGQCELTLNALKLATTFLRPGGIFITKVFRSADYNSLLWVIQQLFDNVTSFKPIASRQSSAEIYLICQNYLAPKKIDPRLLDSSFVFREIEQKKERKSVLQMKKKKKNRSRSGYDESFNGLLYKTANVMEFINSEDPEIILGDYNGFTFDPKVNTESNNNTESNSQCELIFSHKATDIEIKTLLSDLRLLAKSDFRRLLKWRLKMIKFLNPQDENTEEKQEDENKQLTREEIQELEDEQLEADVREMFDNEKREKRKQKRRIRQEKIKRTRIMLMGGIQPNDVWDIGQQEQLQEGLFSLKQFENKKQLTAFLNTDENTIPKHKYKSKKKIKKFYDKFSDSDEELMIEEERMDKLYKNYKRKRHLRTKKEERQRIKDGIGLDSDDEFDTDSDSENSSDMDVESENENDNTIDTDKIIKKSEQEHGGGLVLDDKDFSLKPDSKMIKAKRWFADDIFDDIESNEELDEKIMIEQLGDFIEKDVKGEDDFEVVMKDKGDVGTGVKKKGDDDGKLKYDDLPEILKLPYKVRMKMKKMNRDHRRRLKRDEEKRKERDCLFEEVPVVLDEDSTDSEAIAEVQAIGTKLLCDKKKRMEIIDNSYNKYAFDDEGCNVPQWFKDDENHNYTVNLPVTKAEVREYKDRLKAINARPIKKVAEAKARKKLKAQRIWNKIRRKATVLADNQDLSERTKIKQIEKLYGKLGRRKNTRVYMIAGKGRKARPSDGKKPPKNAVKVYVDKRLKADKLGVKHAKKRKLIGKIKKSSSRRQRNVKNKRRRR